MKRSLASDVEFAALPYSRDFATAPDTRRKE